MAALARCRENNNRSNTGETSVVLGALLGNQGEGRHEAFLSFELIAKRENGKVCIDSVIFDTRLQQLQMIFPNHGFIGWYMVSSNLQVSPLMLELHTSLVPINPAAVLLVFDATLAAQQEDSGQRYSLPVAVYETKQAAPVSRATLDACGNAGDGAAQPYIEVFNENSSGMAEGTVLASRLEPMRIVIESGEAERVATEHVANISRTIADEGVAAVGGTMTGPVEVGGTGSASQIATFLSSQRIAIEMLRRDLGALMTYVRDVIGGTAAFEPDVLQMVQRVLSNRPVIKGDDVFELAMAQEETNFQMVSYLSAITRAVVAVRTVSLRANTALEAARIANTPIVVQHQDNMFDIGMGMGDMGRMMAMMGAGSNSSLARRMGAGRSRGFGDMR
ncbi:hypothetical protein EV175_006667 [Coemansia sp. RSA 1933]|nr:hypothetical protein EV175_006667 [Coemansia sp. RSA 1933]